MERQKSFTAKPTRLLLFSFTIPFSLLFCSFLSFWVLHNTPSPPRQANLQFTAGKAQALTSSSNKNYVNVTKDAVLSENHLGEAWESGKVRKDEIMGGSQVKTSVGNLYTSALDSVVERKVGLLSHATSNFSVGERNSSVSFEERVEANSSGVIKVNESSVNASIVDSEKIERQSASQCDVNLGRWVFDESYPLYTSDSCPYIDEGFSCQANGRKDSNYMKWRWQPDQCNIPRFDPVKMLEMIRGKRLVFVGDSINRNQWESMLCLLRGAVRNPSRVYEARGRRITKERGNYNFKFVDYQCSVEYYLSHFLVHESKARLNQRRVKTLRIDTMDRGSSRWRGADIIIFNTAHWWSHYKTKAGVNYYQEGDQVHPRLDVSTAFRRALVTWASWVDQHITPGKTQVFFRSSAPSHFRGGEWNSGGHCKESMQPLNDTVIRNSPEKNLIVEEVIKRMRTPVTILNITALSGLRIDGHPSVYGRNPGKGSPSGTQDCSHWCLPGVPDTWNELLYFYLNSRHGTILKN